MVNAEVAGAINDQIKYEFESAYFYLSVCSYFESVNLAGFAHWMRMQAREEIQHGMKLFDFMCDRGHRVRLQALDQPPASFGSPLDACEQVLDNERRVTGLIHDLYGLAGREQDYPAQVLLQWYVQEQVEEEKNASSLAEELKMAGDSSSTILLIDHDLATRRPEVEPA